VNWALARHGVGEYLRCVDNMKLDPSGAKHPFTDEDQPENQDSVGEVPGKNQEKK
jgi:hypothetical protein